MTGLIMTDDKTNHEYFEERLSAYLDGELAAKESAAVQRHVSSCAACQWDLSTLRQTVEWTRDLPAMPVPRRFAIPVPAQPVRAPRRQWGFVPVLQGATALVALLLFFAVAGDLLLGSFRGASAPQTLTLQEQAPASVQATQVVEAPKEIVVTVEVEKVVESVVVEMEAPAGKAMPEATEAPMLMAAPATEAESVAEALSQTPTPWVTAVGVGGGEGECGTGVPLAAEAAPPQGPAAAATASYGTTLAPEATPAALPTPSAPPAPAPVEPTAAPLPTPSAPPAPAPMEPTLAPLPTAPAPAAPAPVEPTVIAEARGQAQDVTSEREVAGAQVWREPGFHLLRFAEYVLLVSFVLLAMVTVVAMLHRRRTR